MNFVIALAMISFIEYAGHRWLLHKKTLSVGRDHLQHHKVFTKDFEYAPEVVAWYDAIWIRGIIALLWSSLLMAPVAYYLSLDFGVTFVVVAVVHAVVWQAVHNEMHRPKNSWLYRNSYFRYIKEFHRTHHHYPRTNYGFLFAPVFDFFFRTRR